MKIHFTILPNIFFHGNIGKIILALLLVGIIPALWMGKYGKDALHSALITEISQKLQVINDQKSYQIAELYRNLKVQVAVMAASDDALNTFRAFKAYHDQMNTQGDQPLNVATADYQKLWTTYQNILGKYVDKFGFYDIYLICAKHGHVLYTKTKSSDLGQNLRHGELKGSGLANVWNDVVTQGGVHISDIAPYKSKNNQPSSFLGAPVTNDKGEISAVLAIQIPFEMVNAI